LPPLPGGQRRRQHDFSLLAEDFTSWTALSGEQPRSAMEAAPARMDKLFKDRSSCTSTG